jgi:hypothetical protein
MLSKEVQSLHKEGGKMSIDQAQEILNKKYAKQKRVAKKFSVYMTGLSKSIQTMREDKNWRVTK